MATYQQYSHNQMTSEEAADALEQTIFDSDHLFQKYRDDISPLMQEAELRLGELGVSKFSSLENVLKEHVDRWYRLNKNLSEMALNFRTHSHQMNVGLSSLKTEIAERDAIIKTQRKDYESEKEQYENQLKVLESALANSIPRNKTLDKYADFSMDTNVPTNTFQIEQIKKQLSSQEQQYATLKNENQRLLANIKILNGGSDKFQQTLMSLTNGLAKKEDENLKLRWLTQDLTAERNGLEKQLQAAVKDPNFTSITPSRKMDYTVNFDKFFDEDDDVSDDDAENGLLSLEMADDDGIDPQVCCAILRALLYDAMCDCVCEGDEETGRSVGGS